MASIKTPSRAKLDKIIKKYKLNRWERREIEQIYEYFEENFGPESRCIVTMTRERFKEYNTYLDLLPRETPGFYTIMKIKIKKFLNYLHT